MKKKIAIIGAGISGLVLTNLLKQKSKYEFVLYEKNNSINFNSYGIQLAVNSVDILNKIGFENFDADEKYNPKKIDFYSLKNNKKICELNIAKFNSEKIRYTSLKRSSLVNFFKEKLLTNTIQFNKKIKKINFTGSKIEIFFEDNTSDVTDYLIISDGIFSPSKSILFNKDIRASYCGSLAIRATLKGIDTKLFDQNNISLLLGPNFHLVFYPLNKEKELNVVGVMRKKLDDKTLYDQNFFKDTDNLKKILDKIYIEKNYNLKIFFNHAQNLKCFPIFISDKIRQPKQKNIFFLGDAFFAVPPTFAQGASQSIESAYELFKILDSNNINSSSDYYYKYRIERINMINRRSKLNYFFFHLSNPILIFFRNIIMKIVSNNKFFLNKYLGQIYLKNN